MLEIFMLELAQAASAITVASPSWSPLWIEMPLLVPEVALILVTTIALFRARREDVPSVFVAFGTVLGRLVRGFVGLLPTRPSLPESELDSDDNKDGE
jgi:hypothetical protein